MKKHRHMNYEILRIVAMLMIVCLHYLDKGGALTHTKESFTVTSYAAWLIEAFCLVSVNIYVLLSGYFGIDTSFSIKKPLKIWLQVFFYSFLIGIIFIANGIRPFDRYEFFQLIFPITTNHYWFATSYLILYLISPFINEGFNKLNKKTIQGILVCMIVLFSLSKTFIPMELPIDNDGYDIAWFIVLYITGAYIRRYTNEILLKLRLTRTVKKLMVYIACSLIVFFSMVVIKNLYDTKGILGEMINYGYSYNFFFTYAASVGLFLAFGRTLRDDNPDSRRNKVISKVAGATFGVYLIHEHLYLRYLWPTWFKCEEAADEGVNFLGIHMIFTVVLLFAVCTVVELVRQKLFDKVGAIFNKKKIRLVE